MAATLLSGSCNDHPYAERSASSPHTALSHNTNHNKNHAPDHRILVDFSESYHVSLCNPSSPSSSSSSSSSSSAAAATSSPARCFRGDGVGADICSLNEDTLEVTFSYLDVPSLLSARRCCRGWYRSTRQDYMWTGKILALGQKLNDDYLRNIKQSLDCLQSLELRLGWYSSLSMFGLGSLSSFRSLRSLSICEAFSDSDSFYISSIYSLTHLRIANSPITDAGVQHFSRFQRLSQLEIQSCHSLTRVSIDVISQLTSLTSLSLTWISSLTPDSFASLPRLPHLYQLTLTGMKSLNDISLISIAQISSLRELDLSHCTSITDVGMNELSSLANLHILSLDSTNISDQGICAFGLGNSLSRTLTHLNLSSTRITDQGLRWLSLSLPIQLNTLRINANPQVTNLGIQSLVGLPNLRSLYMRLCSGVNDDGVLSLLKCVPLSYLDISYCNHVHPRCVIDMEDERGICVVHDGIIVDREKQEGTKKTPPQPQWW